MKEKHRYTQSALILMIALLLSYGAAAQEQSAQKKSNAQQTPAAAASPVSGSGTAGQLTKWTGVQGSNTYTLGDSIIFEDKFGKIGIGTKTPGSLLTVRGMIEITLGGFKFPDGTVQTTAGIASIFHDQTLKGNGTAAQPLGIAVPLTLKGSGTLTGDPPFGLLNIINTGAPNSDGTGIVSQGLNTTSDDAGPGVQATGGNSDSGAGGIGALIFGGNANGNPGSGLIVFGGNGGASTGAGSDGASGLSAKGGSGTGAGHFGGIGIAASGGFGKNGAADGLAGYFQGNVSITGNLSKGGGSFKIDHPLDPENKYLYHSFVESPDMKNIYDGVVKLDAMGEATVELPDWFGALNRDFRYLLTAIGAPAPALYIAEEINRNHFKIAGGMPGMKVSWQVTGIRQDAFANKNRIPVEEDKSERERGYYVHPEAFSQPEAKSVLKVQHPELIRQRKEARENARKEKHQ
jgi:hypothetical protein